MSNGRELDKPGVYQIRIKGTLDKRWSNWFDGFTIVPQAENETLLTGSVTDQISLHGLLSKIRDLGLPLLSVVRIEAAPPAEQQSHNGGTER
jgi:hypothetical protein